MLRIKSDATDREQIQTPGLPALLMFKLPRKRLYVHIYEAKVVRPSKDPYIVCTFEGNQFISGRPIETSHTSIFMHPYPHATLASPLEIRDETFINLTWSLVIEFDAQNTNSRLDISLYDHRNSEIFLGRIQFLEINDAHSTPQWYQLHGRTEQEQVSGAVIVSARFNMVMEERYGPEDFQIMQVIDKSTPNLAYQVRKKDTNRIYAMKVLSKKNSMQQISKLSLETLVISDPLAVSNSPFVARPRFWFQTSTDLYLLANFVPGGELFSHIRDVGRLEEQKAKFYIAELVLALEYLHLHHIVYRNLKPENILLDAHGHVALCDFGLATVSLSADIMVDTSGAHFEYLAPELLLGRSEYTAAANWWSLGVLIFEMCCGLNPFNAGLGEQEIIKNVTSRKLRFPEGVFGNDGWKFVKGLMDHNRKRRLGSTHGAGELRKHPFLYDVDWIGFQNGSVIPPFIPRLSYETETSKSDPDPINQYDHTAGAMLSSRHLGASTPLSFGWQAGFRSSSFKAESPLGHFLNLERKKLEQMNEDDEEDEKDKESEEDGEDEKYEEFEQDDDI